MINVIAVSAAVIANGINNYLHDRWYFLGLLGVVVLWFLTWLMRRGAWPGGMIGHLHMVVIAGLMLYGASRLGGLAAPGIHWFGAIPILAGAILGSRGAFLWTGIFIAMSGWLYFGGATSGDLETMAYLIPAVGVLILTYFIFTNYDRAQKELQRTLKKERQESDAVLRVLSHDLNPSLEVIERYLGQCTPPEDSSELKRFQGAHEALRNIREITIQARDWQVAGTRAPSEQFSKIQIHSLFSALHSRFIPMLEAKRIRFVETVGSGAEMSVTCAPNVLINQVLGNLISNAIKFTPTGGRITFRAVKRDGFVHLLICDNGVGVSRGMWKSLFEFGAAPPRVGVGGEPGTGFGLPVAAWYVKTLGGSISLRSREISSGSERHGTVVRVVLPASETLSKRSDGVASLVAKRGAGPATIRLRVLTVDDSEIYHELAHEIFREMGCVSRRARDTESALTAVREERFDAILVDSNLAEESGYQLARKIREQASGRRAKIFYFSASAPSLADKPQFSTGVFDGYILKPIDRTQLVSLLLPIYEQLPVADPLVFEVLQNVGQERGKTLLSSLARIFLETAPDTIRQMHMAAKAGDQRRMISAAHKLRSNSETLGLLRLARVAEFVEKETPPASKLSALLNEIDHESGRVFSYIRAVTQSPRNLNPTP